jgi:DNA-binding transcriptional ArsR family regulator
MDAFTALAEPTRRHILQLLALNGKMPATEIYRRFKATPPAISQHLKVLKGTAAYLLHNPRADEGTRKMDQTILGQGREAIFEAGRPSRAREGKGHKTTATI